MENPFVEVKRLCQASGIFSIAALAAFEAISPDISQNEIARLTKQSTSSIGQWMIIFEFYGLITKTRDKKRCSVTRTPEGDILLAKLNAAIK